MSEKFERCEIWAKFISACGPPFLRTEPTRKTDFTSSLKNEEAISDITDVSNLLAQMQVSSRGNLF